MQMFVGNLVGEASHQPESESAGCGIGERIRLRFGSSGEWIERPAGIRNHQRGVRAIGLHGRPQ